MTAEQVPGARTPSEAAGSAAPWSAVSGDPPVVAPSTPRRRALLARVVEPSPADEQRRRRLVRMKVFATSLLIVMAALFVLGWLLQDRHPAFGYLRAAAEAGMVGALADWFAVTALFRRPLGLPIPHTAIIPTRKDDIGSALSEFVATNFLSEDVVRDKLARFSVAKRVGAFLADQGGAERVTAELATGVRGLAAVLSDDDVAELLAGLAHRTIADLHIGPPLGRIAAEVFERGDHHPLVDFVVDRCYAWIRDNYTTVSRVVAQRAPSWSPRFLDSMVADRIYREVEEFARAVRDDPKHELRKALDRFLKEFAEDLQTDPATMARADVIKDRIVDNAQIRELAGSAWATVKATVLRAADDPSSPLRLSVQRGLASFGRRMVDDPETAAKVDAWVANVAGYLAANHARSLTGIIDETIARWDGAQTSRKIELAVGRDLQFIRINGTVVGALAGLAIYTVATVLFGG
jgi:uncharacterized membrane-anchored protein YjiN (DUF445 family)